MTDVMSTRPAETSMSDEFRAMMRGFPTGIAVVSTADLAGRPWGMTCSSMCSVALEPPTLLVCLQATSSTLAASLVRGAFAVNLLHDGARKTAELFGSGAPDRYDHVNWTFEADDAGPHLRDDTHVVADCRISGFLPVGDHVVVFGEVYRVTPQADRQPLLYGMRRYRRWVSMESAS